MKYVNVANEVLKHSPGASQYVVIGKEIKFSARNFVVEYNYVLCFGIDALNKRGSTDKKANKSFVKRPDNKLRQRAGQLTVVHSYTIP